MDGGTSSAVKQGRLEQLLAKAVAHGIAEDDVMIFESSGRQVLSVTVYEGTRRLGHITVFAATAEEDEQWSLESSCSVLPGLPMQAAWLAEGARRVKAAFDALVAS